MLKKLCICLLFVISTLLPVTSWAYIFINELHYDNTGADQDEAIELAGTAGVDLNGWSLVLYNGNGGSDYKTLNLSGVIADEQAGFGTLHFAALGFQNGSPDGVALVDPFSTVVQFLSYEGIITATSGPANGMASDDIGVSETSSTPIGYSLQLSGIGNKYADFTWAAPIQHTFGSVNRQQTFVSDGVVPEPATLALLGLGLAGLVLRRKTLITPPYR